MHCGSIQFMTMYECLYYMNAFEHKLMINIHLSTFKQSYAVLDWQNKDKLPIKAPENDLFTVQYAEVHFEDIV